MKYLSCFLIPIVIGIVFMIVSKAGRKAEEQMNPEEFTMRLPKIYTWIFAIVGMFFTAMTILCAVTSKEENIMTTILIFAGFALVSLIGLIASLKFRIFIKGNSMTYVGMLGKETEIPYSYIQQVKITQQGVKVKTEVKNFSLDKYTVGLEPFICLLGEKGIEITE